LHIFGVEWHDERVIGVGRFHIVSRFLAFIKRGVAMGVVAQYSLITNKKSFCLEDSATAPLPSYVARIDNLHMSFESERHSR
jgi:hypothetical protein